MKRNIFTLLILSAAYLTTSAQAQQNNISQNHLLPSQSNLSLQQAKGEYQNRFKTSTTRESAFWISYALDADSLYGFLASLAGNYLFPDSTVLVNFDDGAGNTSEGAPWVHELGDVVDPLAFVFSYIDGVNFSSSTPYFVDSAGLYMAYERNTDASVVDTAIVYMFEGGVNSTNLPTYYYHGGNIPAEFGYDTIWVPFINYLPNSNKPSATGLKTFKIPLYESDSSSFYFFKAFSTNHLAVLAGHKVGMAVTFKPGYSYNEDDNIVNTANVMFFASYEENGPGTFPTYTPNEYNVSSIIPTSVRYNIDTFGYNGLFIPCYAYTAPYSLERHLFIYKVTDGVSGINDPYNTLTDFSLTPNPANDLSRVDFFLNNTSHVTISIYDVTGKLLAAKDAGQLSKGQHSQMLDVSKLNAGVYMVSVESNLSKATQKLMVGQ
ncbi:MAG TPA: T9SS type A sorting domain-containing protein [Chitinophagales bacterium]|nr:T9SS type A sorting domain-containing protein [Chitinophagales bacterium]